MRRTISAIKRTGFAAFLILISSTISLKAQDQTVGLFVYDTVAFEGYTLFGPTASETTYLIDMWGRLIHTWESDYTPALSVYLLEDGGLLRTARTTAATAGGSGGGVQKIAWDGTLEWDFDYYGEGYLPHHDIEPLPNGNVLIIAWENKTGTEAIAAGRDPSLLDDGELLPERIVEVEPTGPTTGNVVWEWHAWDHLIQDFDPVKDNYGVVADHPELVDINFAKHGRKDWLHFNSIDYNPELDQIVITSRTLCEIWIIDHSTTTAEAAGHTGGNSGMGGDILYRWGNPQGYDAGTEGDKKLFAPHSGHWVESGLPGEDNILVFNNGQGRPGGDYSSVEEVVTPVDGSGHYPPLTPGTAYGPAEPVWSYSADPPFDFYASATSGAQRLANGNTLICSGPQGTFFEVTADSQTVWRYVNPVTADGLLAQGDLVTKNAVFRCFRHAADYPGLTGRDLTPGGPLEIYPISISGTAHSPSSPTTRDSAVVTSTIVDNSAITVAELYVDTGNGYFALTMFDDGNHHDDLADDDRYGAVIPPVSESTTVSYYVYAEEDNDSSTYDPPNPPATVYYYTVSYQAPRVYLNEFMASNDACCTDDFGDYDDWIELYNAEVQDVSLSGMYLTNDLGSPNQFMIGDTTIPAGGFLVLWADNETGEGLAHTNFLLNPAGGEIGLFDADEHGNEAIDSLTYDEQTADTSYGRFPDGEENWTFFDTPTPGLANENPCDCADHCDLNLDGAINPVDVVFIVNHVYLTNDMRGQIPSCPGNNGDWNCDGGVNPVDVVMYVGYVYVGWAGPPCDPCSP